jgi:DsbC/DsbD-like thiol-disulfide interchange protein
MRRAVAIGFLLAAQTAQAPSPIAWSFKQSPQKPVRGGDSISVGLVADIQPGWHLYSIDQPPGGPIATEISMPAGQPFAFARPIAGPKPHVIFDQNFAIKVQLYTQRAEFTLPIRVAPNALAGVHTLVVEARYQACNDTVCLRPRTAKASLAIQVRER